MNFIHQWLLRLYYWLYPSKRVVDTTEEGMTNNHIGNDAYDPSQDDEKIMKGENETYFE